MRAILHNAYKPVVTKNPVLFITGDGRSLISDTLVFQQWGIPHDTGCIGRSIKLHENCRHWFNADGETAMAWAKQLKEQSQNGLVCHTLGSVDGFDADWDVEQPDYHYEDITNERGRLHGSSAMFAALAGIAMGYEKIVLAGCPMDCEGHWYFLPEDPETLGPLWLGVDYLAWMDFARTPDADKVRSMSGYTADIIGKAERNWFNA